MHLRDGRRGPGRGSEDSIKGVGMDEEYEDRICTEIIDLSVKLVFPQALIYECSQVATASRRTLRTHRLGQHSNHVTVLEHI